MSKARTLANLISDNAELADGQISVAEVVGAAPTASPTFTGNIGASGNITNASGDLTLDVAGDIILDAASNDVIFSKNGTERGRILLDAADFKIQSTASNADIIFNGNDGGTAITALTLDMSAEGNATFQSATTARISLQKTSSDKANIFFDTSNGLQFDNSSYNYPIKFDGSSFVFNEQSNDSDFRVESNGNTHALFVDAALSTVGINTSSTFQTLTVNGNIAVGGSGNKGIYFGDNITSSADQEWLLANNASSSNSFILYEYDSGSYVSQRVEFLSGGNTRFDNGNGTTLVINEAGNDADFRVESDSNANMLFVDAGNNQVKINTTSTTAPSAVDLVVGGGIHVSYADDIALAYQAGTYSNYYKGMSGKNPYNDVGRGLHIFNYDNDSDTGINFWSGSSESSSLYSIANFNAGATGEVVFNGSGLDRDFRIESNNNANMLFVNADQDKVGVGTGGPDSVMHVFGDFKATYYRPLNATNQTSSYHLNFWKLGRIYLVGADAGEIVLQGAKHGYGSGANIVGKTTILLRGGTSATALDGIFYSEGQTSATSPPDVRYVSVGNNSFDIYVKHSAYSSLTHTVTTGGSWTPSLTNTGSTSNPANSVGIPTERSFWLGDREVLRQTQTETVINETSNDHDFRVESNNNANMLFVDAGNDRVGIGLSNPSYPLEVAGQTKVGFDNDSTSLIGTGYNGAFLHNGLNVPANTTTYTPHFEGTARVSGAGYVSHMTVGTKRDGTSSWNNCGFIAYGGNDAGPTQLWEFTVNGQFNSPSTKNFKIKHPLAELNETHDLYHAAIEGPNADLIYRGVVTLVAGSATVNIDTVSRMTEGTFVALTKDIQSFTSNETDWTPVRGSVSGNILTVEAQDNTSTASVSWMVVAKRNDFNVIDNETTDENGEFITERIQ